ncbi:hypothetical protein ACGFNU_34385 [Spirillospora sp. NPDC048911]|uniref:hypothetical protein n=1 Tax=Spirillospora sp. NPDC048911 TaxID=3364527 RepID=UPI003719B89B
MRRREENLIIEIEDDGNGTGAGLPSGGNGLAGIRERATGPRPGGRGFQVRASLPLSVREAV